MHLLTASNDPAGWASYGLPHNAEEIYIFNVEIHTQYRRRGYATSFLCTLHRHYALPIRPIHIVGPGRGFWNRAKALRSAGVMLLPELRCSQLFAPAGQ